jgi:hypothetical protein
VVQVTDAAFHEDPAGLYPYTGVAPMPHGFAQTADALRAIGARYIGVTVTGRGREEMDALAIATGTVDATGAPLVYQATAGNVSNAIIEGMIGILGGTPQDVTTRTRNVEGNPDELDATRFLRSIVPVEGFRDGIAGANPGVSYRSKDTTHFREVIPGTLVDFEIELLNDFREPGDTAEIFRARIHVVGNDVATLEVRQVYIVVPPEGGTILI